MRVGAVSKLRWDVDPVASCIPFSLSGRWFGLG